MKLKLLTRSRTPAWKACVACVLTAATIAAVGHSLDGMAIAGGMLMVLLGFSRDKPTE